jgi:tetratricopeptide (TPR) repeat protein
MKTRTLPFVMLLVFVSLLFITSFLTDARLLQDYLFQLDSTLLYIIISSFACGGLFMFLLFSLLPAKKTETTGASEFQPASPAVTSLQAAAELNVSERTAELLNRLPENHSDYWFARKIAGDLALKEGNLDQAEQFYQEALAHSSGINRALLFLNLGEVFEQRNPEQAAAHYREATHLAPSAIEPVLRLRFLAIRDQDWEEALRWQEHLERFPKLLQKPDEEMIRAGIRCELASAQFNAGAYKTSLALLKFVLKINEHFTPAVLLAGKAYEKLGNHSGAIRTWEKEFHRTQHPVLLQSVAESYLSRGLPAEAIQRVQLIARLYPEYPFVSFCLGDLYRKLEMLEDAIRVFARLQEIQPDWNFNRIVLAETYQRTGNVTSSAAILDDLISSGEAVSLAGWQCYHCNTTYMEYRSLCVECLTWDSINFNQQKAVKVGAEYERPTALPL